MRLCKLYGAYCALILCLLLAACSDNPIQQPVPVQHTPTPILAGGEPILPHSQIHIHDAPLPTSAELNFADNGWTLAGHDSAATRSVALPACCNPAKPVPLWYHSLGVPVLNAPIVSNGRVYVLAADGYLHVLATQTGEEQWHLSIGGEAIASGLALGPLAHTMLYLARAGHFIAALDAQNGQERWRFDTGGVIHAAPLVVGRLVLVTSGANSVVCLDALTGEEYWAFHSEDALSEFWPTRTTPVVANGTDGLVYVALGASTEFHVLNLSTGRKVWEVALHERMTAGPMLDEARGLVYVVTWSGRVVAMDMHTGAIRWAVQLSSGSESSPALSERLNMLYLGTFDGSLYALDASTGQVRWHRPTGGSIVAPPVVVRQAAADWVIVATEGATCVILNAQTGAQVTTWQLGELRATPIVVQGVLYQASLGDQGIFAFKL